MIPRLRLRVSWLIFLGVVIATGILSRVLRTGFVLWDKYLGDALYAAMVYTILRLLLWRTSAVAMLAAVALVLIESFQLTMIPARMMASDHSIVRICARLLGTEFSFFDLLAYGVGIAGVYLVDDSRARA